jgi:hypothetical protein
MKKKSVLIASLVASYLAIGAQAAMAGDPTIIIITHALPQADSGTTAVKVTLTDDGEDGTIVIKR